MIESFLGRMQTELPNRKRWKTRIELANAIFDYLEMCVKIAGKTGRVMIINRVTKCIVVAAFLPIVAIPTAGAATVLSITYEPVITRAQLENAFGGSLCQTNTCVAVDLSHATTYPQAVAVLDAAIDSTPGQKIVLALSSGSIVASQWIVQHSGDADAPAASDLVFGLLGNPLRAYGGVVAQPTINSQYLIVDVARQYDYVADYPDDPSNYWAMQNALAGFQYIHADYTGVNLSDPANIVWEVGNTIYMFVPTKNLPLLEPYRQSGMTAFADMYNEPLRALVDEGYHRVFSAVQQIQAAMSPAVAAAVASAPITPARTTTSETSTATTSLDAKPPTDNSPAPTSGNDNDDELAAVHKPTASATVTGVRSPTTPATKTTKRGLLRSMIRLATGTGTITSSKTSSTTTTSATSSTGPGSGIDTASGSGTGSSGSTSSSGSTGSGTGSDTGSGSGTGSDTGTGSAGSSGQE